MKKLIRLTENDLHRIVKESVNRVLMERREYKGIEIPTWMTRGGRWLQIIDQLIDAGWSVQRIQAGVNSVKKPHFYYED